MARSIDNSDDVIDSRDVTARIEELQEQDERDDAEQEELGALLKLAEQGETLADWEHGVSLIRESYFTRYAEELADDIGAIDRNAIWPLNHIDWEAAARELKHDYTCVEFDGVTYYAR